MIGFERPPVGKGYAETAIALILGRSDARGSALTYPFAVLHWRRAQIAPLRLRRPVGTGDANHRRGRMRCVDL